MFTLHAVFTTLLYHIAITVHKMIDWLIKESSDHITDTVLHLYTVSYSIHIKQDVPGYLMFVCDRSHNPIKFIILKHGICACVFDML